MYAVMARGCLSIHLFLTEMLLLCCMQLRVSCTQLIKVCEAEFRLYLKLFDREPTDSLFSFHGDDEEDSDSRDQDGNDNAFEYADFVLFERWRIL